MALTLPIYYDQIRKAIVDEVQRATKLICIVAEPEIQNVPRPDRPYFSIKMMGPAGKSGDDSSSTVSNTTTRNVGGQRKLNVSFDSYGRTHEDAYNYMTLWQSCLELETVQENLRRASIAVWLNGSVADLSALLQTGFEGRAHMDVSFGVAANLTEIVDYIAEINVNGIATTDQLVDNDINIRVLNP